MAKRVLAFGGAIAMVLVAIVVRGTLDGGGGGGGTTNGGDRDVLRLVCTSELQVVCDGIGSDHSDVEITIEPAAATANTLRSVDPDDAPFDGWLAVGPWPEMVDTARTEKLFADAGAPLGASPFMLAVWKDKRAALACPDTVDLGCLGDAVITRNFRLGTAADDQAEGVLADAALGAGHIKNSDFATNDLNETDLSDWLTSVDASADRVGRNPGGRSFSELLSFGPAAADGFLSTANVIDRQFRDAAPTRRQQLVRANVKPAAFAEIVFANLNTDAGKRLAEIVRGERVRNRLRLAGWDAPQSGKDDGLPSAGVLQALRGVTS